MSKENLINSILTEWSLSSPSGIIDVGNVDELHKILINRGVTDDVILESVSLYDTFLNELRIRDAVGTDGILVLKQSFISKLSSVYPDLASKLSAGDEIIRQSEDVDRPVKIQVEPSSFKSVNSPGETSWVIRGLNDVVFYITLGKEMNALLSRSSSKSEKLQSTDTEALHECFFVIALADQIDTSGTSAGLTNVDGLDDLMAVIDSTRISIKNRDKMKSVFISRLPTSQFSKEVNMRKLDAQKCANLAYVKILSIYGKSQFDYVTRVFETSDGKKVVADAMIKIGDDVVSISLKYGKGQLNNLKSSEVLKFLFGIESDSNFFDTLYEFSPNDIDTVLRFFINKINEILPPKNKSLHIDGNTITYPVFKKISSKNSYYSLAYTTINEELLVKNPKAKEFVVEYQRLKSINITDNIKRYIDQKKTNHTNYLLFLSYVLRCEEHTSYMYVGNAGRSIYIIPSRTALSKRRIDVSVEGKESSVDYSVHINVTIDGHPAFEFDAGFRWTNAQWIGDMNQVSRNLKVFDINWD